VDKEVFITVVDIRTARNMYGGYCMAGVKTMMEYHGIDYKRLIHGAVTVEELESLGDFLCNRVAALARKRASNE